MLSSSSELYCVRSTIDVSLNGDPRRTNSEAVGDRDLGPTPNAEGPGSALALEGEDEDESSELESDESPPEARIGCCIARVFCRCGAALTGSGTLGERGKAGARYGT